MYDISPDGMFVLSDVAINVNDCVDIVLPLKQEGDEPVSLSCMVVHRSHYGIGLIFRRLDSNTRAIVGEYLNRAQFLN
jgi:hypothetical protein